MHPPDQKHKISLLTRVIFSWMLATFCFWFQVAIFGRNSLIGESIFFVIAVAVGGAIFKALSSLKTEIPK